MKQNVILLTVDSLRADHLSCFGYESSITPNIDALARQGTLFSKTFSNGGGSATSFPSIMTSTYSSMNISSDVYNAFWIKLSKRWLTIAEVLKNHGFSTAAFKNFKDDLCSIFGYNRGFNTFDEKIHFDDGLLDNISRKIQFLSGNKYIRANTINKKAISWCNKSRKNFFLWLHYMDVHLPYNPKNISISRRLHAIRLGKRMGETSTLFSKQEQVVLTELYDLEISYFDNQIGDLLNELSKNGITPDNTYFILLSDHGDQLMEHGEWGHGRLYDEVLHVPLIMCGPDIKKGQKIQEQISLLDVAPTITHFLNVDSVGSFCGSSVLPLIQGEQRVSNPVISEEIGHDYSCRTQEWKFIKHCRTNTYELFDLISDPKEKINVFYEYPAISDKFNQLLNHHIEKGKKIRMSVQKENIFSKNEQKLLKNVTPKEEGFISKVYGVPRKQ